jgi:1,2-diacylglycerol-3-alpha-glucose alpha-1,2-galactosyltransferase
MTTINMRSSAHKVKGQGVAACYEELAALVKSGLPQDFTVYENSPKICDIMHYHTVDPLFYAERLTRGRAAVNVGHVHFLPETLDESLRLNFIAKSAFYKYLVDFYNSMDYLVTVNPCIVDKMKNYDLNRPKIVCIPNFVSGRRFHPVSAEEKSRLRERFGLHPRRFTVLGAGQLQLRKGVFDFARTAEMTPDADFVWAGGFSFGKMSLGYHEIKRLASNPPENLRFMGIIGRDEMAGLYNACDLFMLPSFDELFPMVILEALACEMPLLLRDIGVYGPILGDGYLRASDARGFSARISELSADPDAYAGWRAKSAAVSQRYSEEKALEEWTAFYRRARSAAALNDPVFAEGNAR